MIYIKKVIIDTFSKIKKLKVKDIYEVLNKNKFQYTNENIKNALLELEENDKILVDIPSKKRRIIKGKLTLGEDRIVTFI